MFLAVQYAKYMGRRVIAIDTGKEKRQLCEALGAEHWIDFAESDDIVADIKKVTGGRGAHAAIVTAASVGIFLSSFRYELTLYFRVLVTLKLSIIYVKTVD